MNMFNNALLKEYRKKAGITQSDAAKKIGVARTTYADYENGKIQPPIDKIHKICEWLDLPLERMTTGSLMELSKMPIMTEKEKFIYINRIEKKADALNELDDIAQQTKKIGIKDKEKELIINLLDYIAQSYMLSSEEYKKYKKLKEEQ